MYSSVPMNDMQTQLEEEDEDIGGGGEESIDNPNIRYEDGSNGDGGGAVEAVINPSGVYVAGGSESDYNSMVGSGVVGVGGPDQLTLSFQGEVYVFDAVSPEKVLPLC